MPSPKPVEFADLQARKYHCERVSVEGIVRTVDNRWFGGARLDLQIETGGGRLDAHVYDVPKGRSYGDLLDAKIRLVGLASGKFDARREFVRPTIDATGLESIVIEEKGATDPYSSPSRLDRCKSASIFQWVTRRKAHLREGSRQHLPVAGRINIPSR